MSQIPLSFALATELASKTSAVLPLHKLPGCWERRIEHDGAVWWFAINGHNQPKRFEPKEADVCMSMDVPPYSVGVIHNGWIAGLIDAGGGGLINTDEGDVIAVLEHELATVATT